MLEPLGHKAQYNDDSPIFHEAGGGTPQGTNDLPPGGFGSFNVRSFAARGTGRRRGRDRCRAGRRHTRRQRRRR